MGRVRVPIRRIENDTNRHVTFSKRRNGLIKKAYELAILCDIDIALVMFSPSGRLSQFSGKTRIEDVITRYLNLPESARSRNIQNREFLLDTLLRLKSENTIHNQTINSHIVKPISEEVEKGVYELQLQLRMAENQLRSFEPDTSNIATMVELQSCETNILAAMEHVTDRKKFLLSNYQSAYHPSNTHMHLDEQEELSISGSKIPCFLPDDRLNFIKNYHEPICSSISFSQERDQPFNQNSCDQTFQDGACSSWSTADLLSAFVPPFSFSK